MTKVSVNNVEANGPWKAVIAAGFMGIAAAIREGFHEVAEAIRQND